MSARKIWPMVVATVWMVCSLAMNAAPAQDGLQWRARENKVDADIKGWELIKVLGKISRATGWRVYIQPGTEATVSCKFKGLSQDDALRRLLGSLNYAKDETNGIVRLLVCQTAGAVASQFIKPEKKDYRIPNEELVKLKHGAGTNAMDKLAKSLGAKIVGRDDRIGLYRLQFSDADAANAAAASLASDPSVAAVDGNYSVDKPNPALMTAVANGGPSLNLNPQPNPNGPVIGLVDTAAFPPSQFQPYTLPSINVTGTTQDPTADPTHGTMMLETMVEGMANDPSKILPVDVYGSGESTTTYDVMEGIIAAVNAGANPINLSLGGTGESTMMGSLIQDAIQKGIVFVAATGNSPGEGEVYPAAYPGVFSVTASTQTVTGPGIQSASSGQLASYANDFPGTSLMAPGTSMIPWDNQIWMVEGTSVSTADVTGAAVDLANQERIPVTQALNQLIKALPPPK